MLIEINIKIDITIKILVILMILITKKVILPLNNKKTSDESIMKGVLESLLSPSVFSLSRFITTILLTKMFNKINYNYILNIYKCFDEN